MHYYNHNIKDYKADTSHLSALEDGIYRRLIDLYYLEEGPFTSNTEKLARKISLRTEIEIESMLIVLDEFFSADAASGTYKNARCDKELGKLFEKSEKARRAAKASHRNRKGKSDGLRTHSGRSANAVLPNNTITQEHNDGGLPPISPPYPSQSSGSVADAQEKPRGVPEVAKLRDALHKKNPPKLGVLLLLFSLLLLAKPTFAAEKIVVRYTITSTNGHKSKPPAKSVAGGAGGRKGASTPTSPTRTASQSPSPSPRPFEMGGGGRALAGSVKDQVLSAGAKRFGEHHTASLEALVMHESGFNQYAQNGSSGACGLFQAMPCEKMGCSLDDLQCQIDWGFGYIERRYGTPTSAWDFWQSRRPINGRDVGNWY